MKEVFRLGSYGI